MELNAFQDKTKHEVGEFAHLFTKTVAVLMFKF